MARIASLGMYDHGPQQAANDRLWGEIARLLRAAGVEDVPPALDRGRPVQAIWHDPALLFGQICGFPLVTDATLALRVLATPVYRVPGAADGRHRSVFVARHDDAPRLAGYRGRRAAINGRDSNTGMNLFRAALAPLAAGAPYFAAVIETGSHRASVAAVARGDADIAAIDTVTYAAIARDTPDHVAALRILGHSAESATPPFVTARGTPAETIAALRGALAAVMADPALSATRDALFLRDVRVGGADRHAALRTLEIDAVVAGYPDLR